LRVAAIDAVFAVEIQSYRPVNISFKQS